jgi:hypothetical protein
LNKAHGQLEASVAGAEVALDAVLSQPSVSEAEKAEIQEVIGKIDTFGKKEERRLEAVNVRNNDDSAKPKNSNLKKKGGNDEDEEEPKRPNHRTEGKPFAIGMYGDVWRLCAIVWIWGIIEERCAM